MPRIRFFNPLAAIFAPRHGRYFRHGQGNTILIRYSRAGKIFPHRAVARRLLRESGAYTGLTFWKLTPRLQALCISQRCIETLLTFRFLRADFAFVIAR